MSSLQDPTHAASGHSKSQTGSALLRGHPSYSRQRHADDSELQEHGPEDRYEVEQFIRDRFDEAFGSHVSAFMPRLLSLRDIEGRIRAALGLRGTEGRLFLEQYLDAPIESHISAHSGKPCGREVIVEVGHLSGTYPGAMRRMIDLLTRRLHAEGVRWVAFTGTSSLRNAFHRMGLSPIEIAPASRDRLPEPDRDAWGRYYDDSPRVFFGNVQQGHRQLTLQRASLLAAATAAHP